MAVLFTVMNATLSSSFTMSPFATGIPRATRSFDRECQKAFFWLFLYIGHVAKNIYRGEQFCIFSDHLLGVKRGIGCSA